MVVDDEESIVRFMKIALEDHGYKVTVSAGLAGYPGDARTRESLIKWQTKPFIRQRIWAKILCMYVIVNRNPLTNRTIIKKN